MGEIYCFIYVMVRRDLIELDAEKADEGLVLLPRTQ